LCRPFQRAAQISCRGYSTRLQRAITDFGADLPFGRVPEKIQEHYGIAIAQAAVVSITEDHAGRVTAADLTEPSPRATGALTLIVETDGSMIPVVQTGSPNAVEKQDRRKTRTVFWKEGKLSLVRRADEIKPLFAVTMGDAVAAGADMKRLALAAGFNARSRIHGLGDGAPWIVDQMEQQFGRQCRFHVDFYHVCDYLAGAAPSCAGNDPNWMAQQKDRLKSDHLAAVMEALDPFQEPHTIPSEQAPVRRCYGYLANRPGQFNYQAALAANLPIGSGEVESAHRYVIQQRLKLPGAWWTIDHAQAMLNLRVLRENRQWNNYWTRLAA
jgi:hypothetical protein